ncbi:MAG: DUF72 domain-containing protein [Dehalococcoidia bacterium]
MSSDNVHVGTSGWHYTHWKGPFYPQKMASKDFLSYYVQYFSTSEINNSFYQLPAEKTLAGWRDAVPDGFQFAVKGSRYITHMKKLKEPEQSVGNFLNRVEALGDRLGPILFQLPPKWKANPERLESFLKALPGDFDYVFEFRDTSWFAPEIEDLLSKHGAGFCIYDLAGTQSPQMVTGSLVYLRLHGPGGAYEGSYDDEALSGWAEQIRNWSSEGRRVYCYFDNDEAGYAARDGLRLLEMVKR